MEMIQVDYSNKAKEKFAIAVAVFGGFLTIFVGMLLAIAPGQSFFSIGIASGQEFAGLIFVVIGLFSLQEARNQKRYFKLKSIIESSAEQSK